MQMLDKVKKAIERHQLISPGDKVVVAVSGGPDSVCMLHILHRLEDELNIQLFGAHLNHNFRGIEAQMDAQYVAKLCETLNIMCFVKSMDVLKYSNEKGLSSEEAGRILRYQFFDEIVEKVGASKIAVAHNQNDQAETVLMRLLRGAGIQGLTAIHYKRGNIIRPLLDVTRKEIEEYCNKHNLSPRIDHTNYQPIYYRNKIRLQLIPLLEESYNPNIVEGLARTAEILKVDNEFLEEKALEAFESLKIAEKDGCLELLLEDINKLHCALQSRVFRLAAEALVGKKEALEYKHIQSIQDLLQKGETGKKVILPMGITVKKSYERVIFTTQEEKENEKFIYQLPQEGCIYIDELEGKFNIQVLEKSAINEISAGKYLKYFDYEKVKSVLNVRNRKDGDRFWPLGVDGSKKLKDFLIDHKIERHKRDKIPLVCDGDQIMWVVGYRISENYKVTDETKKILAIQFEKTEVKS